MELDELREVQLARPRQLDDPERAAAAKAISLVGVKANECVHADWFLERGADIGVHLHWAPDDVMELHSMHSLVEYPETVKTNLHDHDFFELAYLHTGRATHHHEGGSDDLDAGHLLFLSPGVRHRLELASGSLVVNLILRTTLLLGQSIWAALPHARYFSDYINDHKRLAVPSRRFLSLPAEVQDDPARVKSMIEGIVVEDMERKPGWSAVCESHLVALMTILGRSSWPGYVAGSGAKGEELVRVILGWVQKHYADVTLAQLASQFSYSPSHISRLVRRHTGRKLVDIVRDVKLERAADLLSGSTFAVPEVARSVGFASASHLHKVFRARYGMSPAEYRQRH